ncbi:MAG TPA: glycogen debranching enzyme, partial [Actinomycetota bacterium]|nr:glycogen debranching enzyme [Actinomycetota bacterium]
GEGNADGESHNRSWNCGWEGETDDPEVRNLRERQKRNFLTTLALSQGVPMILGGDEMGRTQMGNNNAYCQDNEISWVDWALRDENIALLGFTRRLMDFRRRHPVFRRRRFFRGREIYGSGTRDIAWLTPAGTEMTHDEWNTGYARSIGVFLNGDEIPDPDPEGRRITDDSFLLLFNAHDAAIDFTLPDEEWGRVWVESIDTNDPAPRDASPEYKAGAQVRVETRSIVVLRRDR